MSRLFRGLLVVGVVTGLALVTAGSIVAFLDKTDEMLPVREHHSWNFRGAAIDPFNPAERMIGPELPRHPVAEYKFNHNRTLSLLYFVCAADYFSVFSCGMGSSMLVGIGGMIFAGVRRNREDGLDK